LGMEILIFLSMAVWMTPHTLVASLREARMMGGAHHPLLGVFGVMSAKNTAVNVVILTTFVSFVLYRRANKERAPSRPAGGFSAPVFVVALSLFPIAYCGVNGFLSAGARAEKQIPELERKIENMSAEILGSSETVALAVDLKPEEKEKKAKYGKLYELGSKQADLEEFRLTPGRLHAEGYRWLTGIFVLLLGLALVDMFVLQGRIGSPLQWVILAGAAGIVVYYGVWGYFVDAEERIGYSVYQVVAVLFAMIVVTAIDLFLFFGSKSLGEVKWGKMPQVSQYVLVLLGVVFTLTMGLMGFARSGIRETWHVYGVVRDTSPQAYTPTLGSAATVITVATLIFFALLFVIFRFGMRGKEAAE
jgi:hypothetical protein